MDMLNHKEVYLKSLEEGMKGVAYSTLPPTTTSTSPYFVDLNNSYNIGQFAYDIGKSISANCGGTGGSGGGGTGGTIPPHDHDNLYAPKIHDHNDLYYTETEVDAWRHRLLEGDLLYNRINANHIQAGTITAGSTIVANGAIGSAQISSLSVDKLEAGVIDTAKFTVQGTNGHLKIIDNKLQINERTGGTYFERVALGDINGDGSIYGLVVRGRDGQTVLYDENGVYNAGITNGAITDEKVGDNANIHGTKLNIQSVIEGINDDNTTTIKGLKVDINGDSITTVINQITMKQDEHTESINRQQTEINQNKDEIALKVSNQQYTEDMTDMTSRLDKAEAEITVLNEGIKLSATKTEVQNQIVEVKDFVSNEINDITIGGANYLYNSFPRKADANTVIPWDSTLNGNHQLTHWQDYNASVQNPQVGYHPHIDLTTFNFPCIAFINKNNDYNMPNRELALKQELIDAIEFIVPDEEYTISFDAYSDVGLFSFTGGLYHNVAESGAYDYHSGRMDVVVQGADINTWKRYYYTFRTHTGVNVNNPVYFVINGHNNPEGSSYVKNIKLERGNKPTHWTPSEFDTVDSSNDVLDEMFDYVDTSIKNLSSSIDIKLDNITLRVESTEGSVNDLNTKYTEIKQTVDSIDLTGVVRFHDLMTEGATIINGANIQTGTIIADHISSVNGATINGQINGVGGIKFDNSAIISRIPSGLPDVYGINISAPVVEIGSRVGLHNATFYSDVKGYKSYYDTVNTTWEISANGNIKGTSLTGDYATVFGNASIGNVTTNQLEVYGSTRCNGTAYISGETTLANILNVRNSPIYGMNNIALARGTVYISQDTVGAITTDHLRMGNLVMSSTDNTKFYFTTLSGNTEPTVYFANRIALGRGSVYLPAGGGNNTTDYLRIGGGFMCGVDSGNFHFITLQGARANLYCGTVSSTYSLDPTAEATVVDDTSVFDEINLLNVVNSEEGYRVYNHSRKKPSKIIDTSFNEKTEETEVNIDLTSSISMLIKAVQELKQENEELKSLIKRGK